MLIYKYFFYISRVPPDPNAPIAPLPLHLHPPPARSGFCMSPHGLTLLFPWFFSAERCVFTQERTSWPQRSSSSTSSSPPPSASSEASLSGREKGEVWIRVAVLLLRQSAWSHRLCPSGKKWTMTLFLSALHRRVFGHRRKESLDSKPSSQKKKISDHGKKERFCIWKRYCLTFLVEKSLCWCQGKMAVNPQLLSLWFMMNPLLAVWLLACFYRKDLSFSKESKKHSDDTERERLASHKCENLVELWGDGCCVI